MGDRLEATAGKPVSLTAGNNVEVEVLHGAKSLFRSSAEGFVVFWDHTVEIIELNLPLGRCDYVSPHSILPTEMTHPSS